MSGKVMPFSLWKNGASASERFSELSAEARAKPERFARVVVIYEEDRPLEAGQRHSSTVTRYITSGLNTRETLGLIEQGKCELLVYAYRLAQED